MACIAFIQLNDAYQDHTISCLVVWCGSILLNLIELWQYLIESVWWWLSWTLRTSYYAAFKLNIAIVSIQFQSWIPIILVVKVIVSKFWFKSIIPYHTVLSCSSIIWSWWLRSCCNRPNWAYWALCSSSQKRYCQEVILCEISRLGR